MAKPPTPAAGQPQSGLWKEVFIEDWRGVDLAQVTPAAA
jgi:hypothetical protein